MAASMRPLTATEWAAMAFERWQSQYRAWSDDDKTSDGVTKEQRRQLFNSQARTPENVARIMNVGWAYPDCSACGRRWRVVVQFKEEWSDESWTLCRPCTQRISDLLSQYPDADHEAAAHGEQP